VGTGTVCAKAGVMWECVLRWQEPGGSSWTGSGEWPSGHGGGVK
jgi:hypothetical protein